MTDRKAALVTGASSGIGLAVAEMLCLEGYAVTMTSRRLQRLDPAAARFRERGYPIHACVADVTVEEDITRVVAEHEAAWGRLDVLVNSAGGGIVAPAGELDDRRMAKQLSLNLTSVILFVHRCLPMLRKAASPEAPATVINVSSYAGKSAAPDLTIYSAAKHGVVGFTASLNAELAASGIRSTVICPDVVDTPLTDYPTFRERMTQAEMITTRDITEGIRFLLALSPGCVVPELILRNARPLNGAW